MRILFLPLITRGHAIGTISRLLAVAEELAKLGGECAFLTNGEGGYHVADAGYAFFEGVLPDPPGTHRPLYDLTDVSVFLNLTRPEYIKGALSAELDSVERFKPDVLVSEFKLTAPITAAATGLPLVSTACAPAHPEFLSPLAPPGHSPDRAEAVAGFNAELAARGLPPIKDAAELFFTRSTAKIAPTSPELEPILSGVPDLSFVGWLLYDRMEYGPLPEGLLERANGKRIVFAYFSAGEIGADQYTKVLPKAFDGTDCFVVTACGHDPRLPELPESTPNAAWERFVPGRRILESASGLLFHGGQNTAMASLLHGVPSLVFPGGEFERDFNARGLERVGSARRLDVSAFTPERLRSELAGIMEDPAYARAARTHGGRLRAFGGPARAAKIIAELAGVGQDCPDCSKGEDIPDSSRNGA